MEKFDTKTETLELGDQSYVLLPKSYKKVEQYFETECGYDEINNRAEAAFQRTVIDSQLKDDQITVLRNHFPPSLCDSLINEFEQDPQGIQHPEVLKAIVEQVFTDEVDEQLRSYFNSEYCIFWWSINKIEVNDDEKWYSTKWHCDGGPRKHLKLLTYLNGFEEHGSDTGYLNEKTTMALKKVGYIFNNIEERNLDIDPLCQHFDIDFQPNGVKASKGDTLIFNPNRLAHRAMQPKTNTPRYALNFCIVPSEIYWKDVAENYFFPIYDCQPFESFSSISKKITPNNNVNKDYIEVGLDHEISNFEHVEYLLANIFKNFNVAVLLSQLVQQQDPKLIKCRTTFKFLRYIKGIILNQINTDDLMDEKWVSSLQDLATYEREFIDSLNRYNPTKKPDPHAIFWPNPAHEKYPLSKFDILPYVKKTAIMDMSTPIGSAGSCFAFEIARYFQEQGYNYVITERNDDPNSGLLVDGYQPGDTIAKFCANFGILFNTPSFCQLAEKAFGYHNFNKLLFDSPLGYYLDPYRENVVFTSPESYQTDYEKHIHAVKEAFLQCKVFVATLGLNECWQLQDGTVMSRNPRENMLHLVKHRTLTVEENVNYIQRFFDIIKQHNPDFKLIISISPIPFLATGRADEHHIITANCHSKAVLRVAADQLVAANTDMYYLPSYELVTECTKDAWEEDTRHVTPETVAKVVGMFKEMFVEEQ